MEIGLLSLLPDGLEQASGAVVNANLRMIKAHPYASQQPLPAQSKPILAVVSSEAPEAGKNRFPRSSPPRARAQQRCSQALSLATGTDQRCLATPT